jgi:hypothetical protein
MLGFGISFFRLTFQTKTKLLIAYSLIQQFYEPHEANGGEMAEEVGNLSNIRG